MMNVNDWKIQGISSLEMAVVLPVLLLVVFGIIQYGLGWRLSEVITNGAREGARFGVVVSDPPISDTQVVTRVQNYLNGSGVDATLATITVSYTDGGAPVTYDVCKSGCDVGVTVSVPVYNLIPALFPLFPNVLSASAVMRHE